MRGLPSTMRGARSSVRRRSPNCFTPGRILSLSLSLSPFSLSLSIHLSALFPLNLFHPRSYSHFIVTPPAAPIMRR